MYLKKLTLRGFKSFASTTTLNLEPGITCVVGPNGSGKSNVVDALAWVMGEQGAKSLRGASMEDVIFAGTNTRAPLGRAEIQLTIDNADGALPIDYAEVTISRTKFRNGNSEYAINGTPCRLLDVRELLSDSGIGRELHVIVGQGHLDTILQATPDVRRGFIEEAAGVLKHRERKEKALRKLESTAANLNRLQDLIAEIRRQLKPLGRQAEVAKRASMVQADLRDAKARLLADDLATAQAQLAAETADEAAVRERRTAVETALAEARQAEDDARAQLADLEGTYRTSQETWFALTGIGERVRSIVSLAGERVRSAAAVPAPEPNPERDPQTLLAQAERISADEAALRAEIAGRTEALAAATAGRTAAETAQVAAEREFEAAVKSSSDIRERRARLAGQLTSTRLRVEALTDHVAQLQGTRAGAVAAAAAATAEFEAAQTGLPDLERQEADLTDAYEAAQAGLEARVEALRLAHKTDGDGAGWVAEQGRGVALADLIQVEPGYEAAVAAGLNQVAEALVVPGLSESIDTVAALRAADRGRAGLLVRGGPAATPLAPRLGRSLLSLVSGDPGVVAALTHLVGDMVQVDSLDDARAVLDQSPDTTVVTREGDVLSRWFVSGGSPGGQSGLQIAAAVAQTETELAALSGRRAAAEAALGAASDGLRQAEATVAERLAALNASDAAQAGVTETLSRLNQTRLLAEADVKRLGEQVTRAESELAQAAAAAQDLEARLATPDTGQPVAPDPTARDTLAEAARAARAQEMEARLALRTLEERVKSLSGQADALRGSAETEAATRRTAEARYRAAQVQAETAQAAAQAGQWLLERVAVQQEAADQARTELAATRAASEHLGESARLKVRDLAAELESIVDSYHRDELARTQQKMRLDALAERALAEVGLDAETLLAQYGPDQPVPVGDGTQPYQREEQLRRLRTAERDLQLLGKINPLALEEFDAMQERHGFLAGQLEDLKKTRADLTTIVAEVDARVQEVFSAAYTDVAAEFGRTFARLFPGGEGRLILTEPGEWLTTGVDVEARPAGKNVKRLSLLSGGERSLVAVCFLIALFKARPSPFYVLDEVEAALDDTNLGRLLDIYEELRASSQLLVITHQKRTMEIADTLYGVTMGSDGTSTVVSQRLRDN